MYLCTCVPVYLCTCVPVYLCTCVPVYLCTCVPVYLCTCVPVYLCTCVPVYLCTCVPVYLCTCVPVYLCTCVPVYLCTCVPVYLCTCVPVYLCTCVPVYLCTCVPVYLCTCVPVPEYRWIRVPVPVYLGKWVLPTLLFIVRMRNSALMSPLFFVVVHPHPLHSLVNIILFVLKKDCVYRVFTRQIKQLITAKKSRLHYFTRYFQVHSCIFFPLASLGKKIHTRAPGNIV